MGIEESASIHFEPSQRQVWQRSPLITTHGMTGWVVVVGGVVGCREVVDMYFHTQLGTRGKHQLTPLVLTRPRFEQALISPSSPSPTRPPISPSLQPSAPPLVHCCALLFVFFFLKDLIQLDSRIQYSGRHGNKFGELFKIALPIVSIAKCVEYVKWCCCIQRIRHFLYV